MNLRFEIISDSEPLANFPFDNRTDKTGDIYNRLHLHIDNRLEYLCTVYNIRKLFFLKNFVDKNYFKYYAFLVVVFVVNIKE